MFNDVSRRCTSGFRLFAAVVCSLWVAFATDSFSYGQTKSDLIRMLRDRETILAEWSVEVEIQKRRKRGADETVVPRTNGIPNNGRLPDWVKSHTTELITFSNPRWIVVKRVSDDVELEDQRIRIAYDGSVTSVLRGNLDNWYTGIITTKPHQVSQVIEFFYGMYHGSYSEAVDTVAESTELISGTLRVKTPVRETRSGSTVVYNQGIIWFDPKVGYAPVRSESRIKNNGEADWELSRYWEVTEFYPDQAGVFLPKQVELKEFRWIDRDSASDDQNDRLTDIEQFEFRNWSVGKPDVDQKFRVAFPANVTVHDQRVGKHFQAIELSDWEILNEVENVANSSIRRYSLFVVVGLVVLIVGWYVLRNRKD